jgi:hypothetical protein
VPRPLPGVDIIDDSGLFFLLVKVGVR